MKVRFELLALLRIKAQTDRLELEVPAGTPSAEAPTVLVALQSLEGALAGMGVRLLEGDRIAGGVLVFVKKPGGGMERVLKPAGERLAEGQSLVLSTAMGGG